jgi:anti-sigma-K factor RskA
MTSDEEQGVHERVQEALGAYVVHALDEDALAEANALIAEHLPRCDACAAVLLNLEATAAMLALAVPQVEPPETLWPRIRRELRYPDGRRWRSTVIGIALAAAVVGLVGWNVTLAGRMGRTEKRQAASAEVLTAVSHPSSRVVPLALSAERAQAPTLAVAYVPGTAVMYVFGTMPEPPAGQVYELWLGAGGRFVGAATFVPEAGEVLLAIRADPFRFDTLFITVEPAGGSRRPSPRHLVEGSL